MHIPKRKLLMEKLGSETFKRRLAEADRFEQISGGGMLKRIQRLLTAPDIYIPYLLYAKAGMSRRYLTTTTLFWGRAVRIPLQGYDALGFCMFGGYGGPAMQELKLVRFFIKSLGKDDVFYDIGANYGSYTYLAAELCRETHAFEPIAELAEVVRGNIHTHEDVVVNVAALSEVNGSISFYIMQSRGLSTMNTSVAELHSSHANGVFKRVTVPTITIDDYVATHAQPTFLKIDVEGAEEQVIKGGAKFFSSHAPIIAMEIWGKENKWELSMNAAERLRGMGYQSFRLTDQGDVQKIDGDLSAEVSPAGAENFIFKK